MKNRETNIKTPVQTLQDLKKGFFLRSPKLAIFSSVFLSTLVLFLFFGTLFLTKSDRRMTEIYQSQPECQGLSLEASPNPADGGEDIVFSASFADPLVCVELETGGGTQGLPPVHNFGIEGVYYWEWTAKAGSIDGVFTASFKGNTADSGLGDCPDRAVGIWCETSVEYTVGTYQASPSPSPSPSTGPQIGEGYIFKIKGSAHRQIIFCQNNQLGDYVCTGTEGLSIDSGGTTYSFDFTGHPLEFGDVNHNGQVDTQDYSFVKNCRILNSKMGDDSYEQSCYWADGNFDGEINSTDIDLLYKTLSGDPDDE